MKLREAIARADELRPNALSNDLKAMWVYDLEGEIAELMDKDFVPNPYPQDSEEELLMPYPKDNIYYLYLTAMIDLALEDTGLYQMDMTVANSAIQDAKAWYRRHNLKKSEQRIRAFSWQPKFKEEVKEDEPTEDTGTDTEETGTDTPTTGD